MTTETTIQQEQVELEFSERQLQNDAEMQADYADQLREEGARIALTNLEHYIRCYKSKFYPDGEWESDIEIRLKRQARLAVLSELKECLLDIAEQDDVQGETFNGVKLAIDAVKRRLADMTTEGGEQ